MNVMPDGLCASRSLFHATKGKLLVYRQGEGNLLVNGAHMYRWHCTTVEGHGHV